MHTEKYTDAATPNQLRHVNRTIENDKNKDIDLQRTEKFNYSLTPYINDIPREQYFSKRAEIQKREYEHYKERKAQLYVYGRDDIKTLAGTIVPLPKEIKDEKEELEFFKAAVDFLSDRYGAENIISATVHKDEHKMGQTHMHLTFIPACEIDKKKLFSKKKHCKAMEDYKEKISANDVLTKRDLDKLHPDFQKYLDEKGIKANVLLKKEGDGKTINLSVEQLKEITKQTGIVLKERLTVKQFAKILQEHQNIKVVDKNLKQKISDLEKENAQLHEQINSLQQQIDKQHTHTWGNSKEWSAGQGWGNSKEQEVTHTW